MLQTLDRLKPEVQAQIRIQEEIKAARRQSHSIVNASVKHSALKKKTKMETLQATKPQFTRTIASDVLGDPSNKFYFLKPNDPNDRKHNLKYAKVNSQKIDEEKPFFFQCPPGAILESSMEGLGPETAVKDMVLSRKFKMTLIFGIFERQMIPNPEKPGEMIPVITNRINPFPIWSRWQADQYYLQNIFERTEDEQRKPEWEIQRFFDNNQKIIVQVDNFLLYDEQFHDILKATPRWKTVNDHALNAQTEWAEAKRQKYVDDMDRDGYSDFPSIEASQWKITSMGKAKLLKEQIKKLNTDMILPTDWKMSDNIQTLRTVLINSFLYDLKKTSAGMGRSHAALLERAFQQADEFIENTPDLLNRLVTIKFERPVWRAPPKTTSEERETANNAAAAEYDKIRKMIKLEKPNLKDTENKLLADEKILPFILEVLKYTYNMPEVTDFHGCPPQEKGHTSVLDRYLKPHAALSIATMVMLTYMVNLSIPKAEMAWGLKYPIIGKIHRSFGAAVKHVPSNAQRVIKSGITTEDYESSFADFLNMTEKMIHEKGSFESYLIGEPTPSFVQMAETSGLNDVPMENVVPGEPEVTQPDYNILDFQAQNGNGELDGGNPAADKPKSKMIAAKAKKRGAASGDVPQKSRRI